jgi:hypothetical protein
MWIWCDGLRTAGREVYRMQRKKKTPAGWQGSRRYLTTVAASATAVNRRECRGGYSSPPAALVRASSMAFGAHMMLKKVAPLELATIGRSGQSMASRNRP